MEGRDHYVLLTGARKKVKLNSARMNYSRPRQAGILLTYNE